MPKQNRVYLTLKDETRTLLEQWADQQGRPLANLVSWIVERSVQNAIASGELKPQQSHDAETLKAAIAYIQALTTNGCIDVLNLQRLADELKIPSEQLAQILKKATEGKKNGTC